MKSKTKARIVAASMTWASVVWLAASCASSEDELFPAEGAAATDGGFFDSAGGAAGVGGGVAGFPGAAGVAGTAGVGGAAGIAGTAGAGAGGVAGTAGMAGTAGTAGASGTGSCNPNFCPNTFGTACCQTPNGPCGCDMGMGCMPCGGPGGS